MRGTLVDVGCGAQPYRSLLHPTVEYIGIDIAEAEERFGYLNADTRYFTGDTWPVDDATADTLLATELLEHVVDPSVFMREAHRSLKPGGKLILTVPFAARWHFIPHDYWRFTPSSLELLLGENGFENPRIYARGNELTVASYKTMALILPLLFPQHSTGGKRVGTQGVWESSGSRLSSSAQLSRTCRFGRPGATTASATRSLRPARRRMTSVEFRSRPCPVCGSADDSHVIAEGTIDPSAWNELSFSSRKLPEYVHHRMVECPVCDLVYASPTPAEGVLEKEYQEAPFVSSDESAFAATTYRGLLQPLLEQLPAGERHSTSARATAHFCWRFSTKGSRR